MTTRRRISTRERLAIFTRENGACHLCGRTITAGEAWEISHDIPLELGGEDDGMNLKPAHKKCHRDHTAKIDQPTIAKAKRRAAKHIGAARPAGNIKSPGFVKSEKTPKINKSEFPQLARRSLYR